MSINHTKIYSIEMDNLLQFIELLQYYRLPLTNRCGGQELRQLASILS